MKFRRWTVEFRCQPGAVHAHDCSSQWIGSSRRFWTEAGATREATARNDAMREYARAHYRWSAKRISGHRKVKRERP